MMEKQRENKMEYKDKVRNNFFNISNKLAEPLGESFENSKSRLTR